MDTKIRVSTECWPWRIPFSHHSHRDLNLWPFTHKSGTLTTELSLLPCYGCRQLSQPFWTQTTQSTFLDMDHPVSHYGHRPPSQLSRTQTTHSAFLDRHRPPSQPTWTKPIQLVVYLDTDHHQLGLKSMQPKPWKVRPIFWWMFNFKSP